MKKIKEDKEEDKELVDTFFKMSEEGWLDFIEEILNLDHLIFSMIFLEIKI